MTTKYDPKAMGVRIRQLRKERRWTQKALGKMCGVSRAAIGAYERGELRPSAEVLDFLADAFDVAVEQLVEAEGITVTRHGKEVARGPDVFISCADEDQSWADDRASVLRAAGLAVFLGVESCGGVESWPEHAEWLRSASRYMLGWSQYAASSQWVERMWREALQLKRGGRTEFMNVELLDDTPLPTLLADLPSSTAAQQTRVRLDILVDKQFECFRQQDAEVVRYAIAALLGVAPSNVRLVGTAPGSMHVVLELPNPLAARVLALHRSNGSFSTRLAAALGIVRINRLPLDGNEFHEQYRQGERSFVFANLLGARIKQLEGADLRGACLTWANLQWANLQHANLQGASLRWANLEYADLDGALLQGADLRGTVLATGRATDELPWIAKMVRARATR